MSQEEKVSTSSQHPIEGPEGSTRPPVAEQTKERRAKHIKGTIYILAGLSAITTALFAPYYFQSGVWQLLVDSGITVLNLGCLALAYWSVRRGELDTAGYWMLVAVVIGFSASELAWVGETLYIAIIGLLTIFLVGSFALPQKPVAWLAASGSYVICLLLINLFEPLSRYNAIAASSGVFWLDLISILILTSLALAVAWRLVRAYRRLQTIRVRLLAAFVFLVLASVAIIGIVPALISERSGRRQVFDQLESVARIKEAEIGKWIVNLQTDLSAALSGSQAEPRAIALLQTPDPSESQKFWMRSHLQAAVEQTARFDELFLITPQGQTALSTDVTQEGIDHGDQAYFRQGLNGFYTQPPVYDPAQGRVFMIVARPVVGPDNQALGVLAGRVNPETLVEIMGQRAWLGDTGEVFLADRNQHLLTPLRFGQQLGISPGYVLNTQDVSAALETQNTGAASYDDYQPKPVVGIYHWLPELETVLVAKQDQSEAFSITRSTLRNVAVLNIVTLLIAVAVSLLITRSIAGPLASLTETATQIAAGDLALTAPVEREDEVGALARAFNSMTAQLRQSLEGLEQQVTERTADLEATMSDLAAHSAELEEAHQHQVEINRQLEETIQQSERRAKLLQASAEVSRAVAQIKDLRELLPQITRLISQHFGFYHAGIFLIDQAGRYAVLRAANSSGGQRMLARHHKLAVGSQGIVGYVTDTGQPRIALDVGADAVFFNNPDLPDTRSEMSLPLRTGDEIIGALDVQSTEEVAFEEQDVVVLTALADQIAIAIENAHLFERTQAALEDARQTQQRYVQQEWFQFIQEQTRLSHEYTLSGVPPVGDALLPEAQEAWLKGELVIVKENKGENDRDDNSARAALAVPIKFRDEVIGVLDLHETDVDHVWSEDQIALVQAIADQLGQALERARLFERTQTSLAETQTLFETSRSLAAAQEMEEIWQAVIYAARQRRADACALLLFDTLERKDAHALVLAAGWEQQTPIRLPVGTELPLSDFEKFDVLGPGRHFSVTNLLQAERVNEGTRRLMTDLGFSALHHQPIAVRDHWFGLLTILYESPHTFTEAEVNFYRTLSDQAALALESQHLLFETQRRAEREQMIRQITDKVHATPDVEKILQTTARELSKALGLPRVFVRLGTEKELSAALKNQRPITG